MSFRAGIVAAVAGLLTLSTASFSQETPGGPAGIRFPSGPVVAPPLPAPSAVPKLTADALYVVDSDVPLLVFASPAGVVRVTKEEGPLRVRGKFIDGTGKLQTRTYKGKFVVTIEAAATARVEVVVVPVGAKTEVEAVRKLIDVDDGTKPIPPPDPIPDPKPKPPPEPAPVTSFKVFLVVETSQVLTQQQFGAIYGKAVEDTLTALCGPKGAGWQIRDKDADPEADTTALRPLWVAAKPLVTGTPCVAAEINGKAVVHPLPADAAATIALLKKLAGGK